VRTLGQTGVRTLTGYTNATQAQEWPRWRFLPFLEARAEARVLIKSAYMQSGEQWAEWCRQEVRVVFINV
jgi:hypothetical protein